MRPKPSLAKAVFDRRYALLADRRDCRLDKDFGIEMTREYLAVIEREGDSWGAYFPTSRVWASSSESREEVEHLIREAISFHLDALREAGDPIPAPSAVGTTSVAVRAD